MCRDMQCHRTEPSRTLPRILFLSLSPPPLSLLPLFLSRVLSRYLLEHASKLGRSQLLWSATLRVLDKPIVQSRIRWHDASNQANNPSRDFYLIWRACSFFSHIYILTQNFSYTYFGSFFFFQPRVYFQSTTHPPDQWKSNLISIKILICRF